MDTEEDSNRFETKKFIKEILQEYMPAECDIVGDHNLDIMIDHPIEFVESRFGAKLDYLLVYQAVAGLIDFINNSISIYAHLSLTRKNKSTSVNRIVEEKREITIRTIIEKDRIEIIEKTKEFVKRHESP